MLSGKELIADVEACRLEDGQCAFWWLGQHSFIVKLGEETLYLDPFLSDLRGRRVPPLLRGEEVANATLVFGTHDHADHIDRRSWPAIAQASPGARFVVPALLVDRLSQELPLPKDRFIGIDDRESVDAEGLRLTGVASAHELLDPDPRTGQFPCMGYVIRGHGVTLYHAGDTCLYEGLQTRLRALWPALIFLPINGRDAARLRRNCIGNMTYQEAADLAGALQPRLTVPAHFDMFEGNRENPQLFADYMAVKYPDLSVHIPRYGERYVLTCR